jgi:predicted PurR-regulated permease PerM
VNRTTKIIGGIFAGLVIAFLIWEFSNIVFYLIVAIILSLIGKPLVKRLNTLRLGKFKLPNGVSALLTLIVILVVIGIFLSIFVPLVTRQAAVISNINLDSLSQSIQGPLQDLEIFLHDYGILSQHETINQVIEIQLKSILNLTSFSNALGSMVGLTGTIFIAVFSILFLTFFFLKDAFILDEVISNLTPVRYENEVNHILKQSKRLLGRYFVGLLIEITSMITLLTVGLSIFGVENAVLIGFFGGLMNIIPYLGPLIGAVIGLILAISTILSSGMYSDIVSITLIIFFVFSGAKLIDDFILQPLIYANSVKAHPVEIFLVILIAGTMSGITGMILAIPTYTVLRIIAKEFLSQLSVVQKLTKNI